MSASERGGYATTNAGQAEVVAQDRNANFSHAADDCFDLFDLLRTLRTIQKNVMPVRGVEILNGGEHQARRFNLPAKLLQFRDGPKLLGIACHSPRFIFPSRRLIGARVRCSAIEIVDQVDHDVSAASL